jgi:probable F420-dependent oxidoreductase
MSTLNGVGVFTSAQRIDSRGAEIGRLIEDLGYDAVWVADVRGDLSVLHGLLDGTQRIMAGSAIMSMWDLDPSAAAAAWAAADSFGSGRAIVGIGVSHSALVKKSGQSYDKPLTRLRRYLDELDQLGEEGIPVEQRMIGANGPKMLQLAGQRSLGALSYLVTPERTAKQRVDLGPEAILAPEVKVALGPNREAVRAVARQHLKTYLTLPNYLANLERMGFTSDDFSDGGSNRLVDALVVGPDVQDVVKRVEEHRDAGADHICLHALGEAGQLPVEAWRELAPAVCSPRKEVKDSGGVTT